MGRVRGGIIGIDYSMTSPSLCVFTNASFSYSKCRFYYLTDKKKLEVKNKTMEGTLFDEYTSQQERFDFISNWAMNVITKYKPNAVYMEDYSFGSTGRVFNIAENAGLLKYKMWISKQEFYTIPPTVIKKFATGKGNANKEAMENAFISETSVDVKKQLGLTPSQWNPSSDIIDSYYICKYGYDIRK
jgi:Holliday junction resolvasome RuvABC endonuclease subunit